MNEIESKFSIRGDIFKELKKACFQHDMSYGYFAYFD